MPLTKTAVTERRKTDPLYNAVVAGEEHHAEGCPQWRAMCCTTPIECPHGYDVCPVCDPCTCGPAILNEPPSETERLMLANNR